SIAVIMVKLVILVFVILTVRIAMCVAVRKVTYIPVGLSQKVHNKDPHFLDCWDNQCVIYPGHTSLVLSQLGQADNPVEQLLRELDTHRSNQYLVILVRPKSKPIYSAVRKLLNGHRMDVAIEPVEANYFFYWDEVQKTGVLRGDF